MFKKIFITIFILSVFTPAFAAGEKKQKSWDNDYWPGENLPRFETKQEKESGKSAATDRITPPPAGEVELQGEFEDCEGVIVRYPYGFGNMFAEMVNALQDYGNVYILVNNSAAKSDCYNYLINQGVPDFNIEYIVQPTNAIWTRDYGPWFVWEENGDLSIIDMIYYPDRPLDDYIPEYMENYWDLGYYGPDIHHEGGNMMTDGHGTMMMTTRVLEANPGISRDEVCEIYEDYFGQDTTYIFDMIQNDLTGHIDLWAKMMNDTTILVAQMQAGDVNYALVESYAAMMDNIPTAVGGTFHIVRCPMPSLSYWGTWPYYKSYINSVLFNGLALIPIYGLQLDSLAIAAYQEALGPEWDVIGVNSSNIAPAGGAIHCTTIGVPLHDELYVHDLELSLQPVSSPIIIPPAGGNFSYNVELDNLESNSVLFDYWVEVTLPNGSVSGPVFLKNSLTIGSLGSIARQLNQTIPANAPAGTYTYTGYAGSHLPRIINAQSSFTFVKNGTDRGNFDIRGWDLSGWDEEIVAYSEVNPGIFTLEQNYPNPFNPETAISFMLNSNSNVKVSIYNINGELVEKLKEGYFSAGSHKVIWNAGDRPAGVYFCRVEAFGSSSVIKMILMK